MPYLMGGFPDVAGSLRLGEALVDAGADLIELGVPFSDPARRRPRDPGRRASGRCESGATFDRVARRGGGAARRARRRSC